MIYKEKYCVGMDSLTSRDRGCITSNFWKLKGRTSHPFSWHLKQSPLEIVHKQSPLEIVHAD